MKVKFDMTTRKKIVVRCLKTLHVKDIFFYLSLFKYHIPKFILSSSITSRRTWTIHLGSMHVIIRGFQVSNARMTLLRMFSWISLGGREYLWRKRRMWIYWPKDGHLSQYMLWCMSGYERNMNMWIWLGFFHL